MASNAFAGVGTKFYRGSVAPANLVAEVNSIAGPNATRNQIDVTSLDSTGGYKEYIGGFRDGGEVTLNMNFTKASYGLMQNDFEDNDLVSYIIVLPDASATTISFDGFVQNLGFAVPTDDKVTADITIKVSGAVTLTS